MGDENENNNEQERENVTENSNQSKNLFDKTNEATERLEKANAKTEELLNRQEELYAKQKLGGQTEAAIETPKPKELSDLEYSKKALKGELGDEKEN